jgi:hypothetical protein
MRYDGVIAVCLCADNAVSEPGGCRACADDEIVVGDACACAPNQTKNPAGVCAAAPGLGVSCDAANPCSDAIYDFCAVRGGVGSCANRCTTDTDCPASYVCADWEAVPSCRTFTGYGMTCAAPDGCASFDANTCLQGYCVVHGCTVGTDDCPRDTKCCDFSGFGLGTVCAPAENCP